MRLSTRAIYSLRLMVYLSDNYDRGEPIKLKEIAKEQGLPFKYLEQLVMALKNQGLIRSVQGKLGGYTLAKPGDRIKALDVIDASMGGIDLLDCVTYEGNCKFEDVCTSRKMWGLIKAQITDVLAEYSLNDLSETKMLERYKERTGEAEPPVTVKCDKKM